MKKTEKILGVIALFALLLKLLKIEGGSILLVISLSSLAIFYYFGFFFFNEIPIKKILKREVYKGMTWRRKFGIIFIGFAIATVIVGILFKLQSYEGAGVMLTDGVCWMAFLFIILMVRYQKNKSEIIKRILLRIIVIGGIGLLLYLIPKMTIIRIFNRGNPGYIEVQEDAYTEGFREVFQDDGFMVGKSKHGIKNGLWKEYSRKEKIIKFEWTYVNDTLEGPYKSYWSYQKIKTTGFYKNGGLDGIETFYDEQGRKIKEIYWEASDNSRASKLIKTVYADEEKQKKLEEMSGKKSDSN